MVREILSSEQSYVTSLAKLIEEVLKPLRRALDQGRPILSEDEIRTIFSNIEEV